MDEPRSPILQVAYGVAAAMALFASLVVPLWVLESALLAVSIWLIWWMAHTPIGRLASPRRIPRFIVFGPLAVGIAANLHLVNVTGRMTLVLNLVAFVGAFLVGVARIVRSPAAGTGFRPR